MTKSEFGTCLLRKTFKVFKLVFSFCLFLRKKVWKTKGANNIGMIADTKSLCAKLESSLFTYFYIFALYFIEFWSKRGPWSKEIFAKYCIVPAPFSKKNLAQRQLSFSVAQKTASYFFRSL